MLLVATASAPESVGGSLAALALYDIVRARIPATFAATGDPLGILYRTYAHRDIAGTRLQPQPIDGVPILNDLEGVPAHGRSAGADALVFDATGDLSRDVRAWPDQLRHLIKPPVRGVLCIVSNDSGGAKEWLTALAADHPDTFARTIVLSYPIGRSHPFVVIAGRHSVPAPILTGGARAQLDSTGLSPTTLLTWTGSERSPSNQRAVRTWLDAWRQIIDPFLDSVTRSPLPTPTS